MEERKPNQNLIQIDVLRSILICIPASAAADRSDCHQSSLVATPAQQHSAEMIDLTTSAEQQNEDNSTAISNDKQPQPIAPAQPAAPEPCSVDATRLTSSGSDTSTQTQQGLQCPEDIAIQEHDRPSISLTPLATNANMASTDTNTAVEAGTAQHRQPRLFLDLFAGIHSPLTTAMIDAQGDCFEPFDLDGNA